MMSSAEEKKATEGDAKRGQEAWDALHDSLYKLKAVATAIGGAGLQTEMDDEVRDGLSWVLADLVQQADSSFCELAQLRAQGLLVA